MARLKLLEKKYAHLKVLEWDGPKIVSYLKRLEIDHGSKLEYLKLLEKKLVI